MRKCLRVLLLSAVFTVLLCGSALAAEGSGMYAVTGGLKPMTAGDDNPIESTAKTIDGQNETFYAGAERVQLDYNKNVSSGDQCLVFVLDDGTKTPNAENIVYIDQVGASGDSVSFKIYPKSLVKGKTYSVYVSTSNVANTGLDPAGTFKYNTDFIRGDANMDDKVDYNDAISILKYLANKEQITETGLLAAKVTADPGAVSYKDAIQILQYLANKATL